MPAERTREHSLETIGYTLKRLGEIKDRIVSAQMAVEAESLVSVSVPREPSREEGLTRLSAWADALRDAVDRAMDKKLGNGKPVSVSPPKA